VTTVSILLMHMTLKTAFI